jgi:hypothetical protein
MKPGTNVDLRYSTVHPIFFLEHGLISIVTHATHRHHHSFILSSSSIFLTIISDLSPAFSLSRSQEVGRRCRAGQRGRRSCVRGWRGTGLGAGRRVSAARGRSCAPAGTVAYSGRQQWHPRHPPPSLVFLCSDLRRFFNCCSIWYVECGDVHCDSIVPYESYANVVILAIFIVEFIYVWILRDWLKKNLIKWRKG